MLEIVQVIGAAAGVVAGVGLAGLSALHFSHARDLKRLREWAVRDPQTPRAYRRDIENHIRAGNTELP